MDRLRRTVYILPLLLSLAACSTDKRTQPAASNQPLASPRQQTAQQPPQAEPGALRVGEASGSCTAKGETVQLKYAYAGRGVRFGNESLIILLTDQPIPPEALADELKSQTMFNNEKIRGLEYVIDKDGYWVRYHPSQYQESKGSQLKDFSVENDIVKGRDVESGEFLNGNYARSVKFVAAVTK